ncbi:hypothetical protein ILUMI_03970 [Ignelater luminosus]|uniref:Uncharacterized protein n=1 Tax=Ignelater luminosus TaxID=2038154 RepID=A0A8K0DKQ2_IGNLU|nr:hypothetical protein ILUMI_03970 [Ignelater luminosus]
MDIIAVSETKKKRQGNEKLRQYIDARAGIFLLARKNFRHSLKTIIWYLKEFLVSLLTCDFNARVGLQENDEVVSKYGKDVDNNSGEDLIELCAQKLRIFKSQHCHKTIYRSTWERPILQQRSVIDYVITRQSSKTKPQDCKVKRGANCRTDNYLINQDHGDKESNIRGRIAMEGMEDGRKLERQLDYQNNLRFSPNTRTDKTLRTYAR